MTGSGKTGLCISLLEEAAIDGIPAIIIDPKGDLCNLLLTFPNLAPQDFAPWVTKKRSRKSHATLHNKPTLERRSRKVGRGRRAHQAPARRRRLSHLHTRQQRRTSGLDSQIIRRATRSNQAGQRITRRTNQHDCHRACSALVGIEADPVRSREHILLSNILNQEWSNGRDLDIAGLIQKVQSPSITKIGVMDLDSFFPANDRFNSRWRSIICSRRRVLRAGWKAKPLDIPKFLHTEAGKPRLSIFSIAHLGDAERMFFVSLLLNQVLGWMRTQSGTTSLRAILYMDEIFGYFPPVANPPSKLPLLTLLKQGRAFGLGVVLATQNPVDLDYKGLANTGTWFIGRLQTERDKARVLEGLEGIAAGTGQKFDKQAMEQLLAGLDKRIFLLNNVHDDAPEVFETRWALSYLRGPLTRAQIKTLMDPLKQGAGAGAGAESGSCRHCCLLLLLLLLLFLQVSCVKPIVSILPPEITQYYIPVRSSGGCECKFDLSPNPSRRCGGSLQRFKDSRHDPTGDVAGGVR